MYQWSALLSFFYSVWIPSWRDKNEKSSLSLMVMWDSKFHLLRQGLINNLCKLVQHQEDCYVVLHLSVPLIIAFRPLFFLKKNVNSHLPGNKTGPETEVYTSKHLDKRKQQCCLFLLS